MRLTGFSVRNFKSIGNTPAVVRLAPVTLLFGPNGAGKSSLLHALHYAREIVEHANLDADVTRTGGSLDLGGFANFVHARDLDRDVVLTFDIDLEDDGLPDTGSVNDVAVMGFEIGHDEIASLDEATNARVTLTISWSHMVGIPYVARTAVAIDGEPFAALEASAEMRSVEFVDLNEFHPVFRSRLAVEPDDLGAGERFASLIYRSMTQDGELVRRAPVHRSRVGALPFLDRNLGLDQDFSSLEEMRGAMASDPAETVRMVSERLAINAYASRAMIGALRALRDALAALVHVGPLRALPPRGYLAQRTLDAGRWHSGLAAWDRLHHDDGTLVPVVDDWLSDRLHSGFGVRIVEERRVPVGSAVDDALRTPSLYYDDELDSAGTVLYGRPVERRIALTDTGNYLEVTPHDIGVGISQLLPVIVAALAPENRLVAIEQPELHIHPRLQTQLGDMFVAAIGAPEAGAADIAPAGGNGRTLLIETHSEHLLLRLLRRIRHTDASDLAPGEPLVTPALVAVHYAEPGLNGMEIRELRISRDGDFLDDWPGGFFDERGDELFK
ncbi:AAA family ATPase [Glacieibacterium frigidum]|uniref:AAA family ATPase n=1 Tax=Glacieibacterium frigidum TaxID=2593303 RepID=A0A552UAB9_9SPHN|nr:AAA family ATPase [Glacieibacterium frigidum]TRW15139.1 AAA family ATPase [Glacieibacterium frigidum]